VSVLLTPRDLLLPEGREAALTVEVERAWIPFVDPPLAGVEVSVEGHGASISGPDGLARVPLKRLPPGLHALRVRARGDETEALVRVAPGTSGVLVTDIDHTIADVSPAGFILKPNRWVKPLPGARDALEALSRRMEIVYLTARDHVFLRKTRRWLRMNAFPEGPLFTRAGTRFWTTRSREHKLARLAELRELWSSFRGGVGDMPGDMEAYAARGLPPILIGPRKLDALPAGTVWTRSWPEILETLKS
jgi:phosphatidate phosphatase APP1